MVNKKIILIIMSLIFILYGCTFAKNENEEEENNLIFKEDSYKELSTKVNIEEIVTQINMSKTEGNGYRFCNLEFLNKSDPYSTYYINSIKKLYNNDIKSQTIKSYYLNKLEDSTLDNLVDVHYSVLLINDDKAISELTKDKIQRYLDSLYNKNGYYSIQPNLNHSVLHAMLSTHYAISTYRSLNIEYKNVDNWLNEVQIALLADENMIPQNSGLYLLYYKILELLNKDIPENMYQYFINKLDESILNNKIDDVYMPGFYSDFIYLCEQFSHDYNNVKKEILNSLIKDSVLDKDNVDIYDPYSIYETLGVLKSLNYEVLNLFEESMDYFNKFELYDSLYITPGKVDGNLLDTYYVIKIMELIDVKNGFDTYSYLDTMKNEILQGDPVQVDVFIQYLSDSGKLSILDDIKTDLIDYIRTVINHVLESEYEWAYKIKYLNATINSINILTKEEIDENTKKEIIAIIREEKLSSDIIQNISENCELYELMFNLKFDNKSKNKVLGEIDKNIVKISEIDMTGKVSLLEKVYNVYEISGKEKPTSLKNLAIDVLELSIHESGLFKGGDSNADIISFQYIHDSLQLISSIKEGSLK